MENGKNKNIGGYVRPCHVTLGYVMAGYVMSWRVMPGIIISGKANKDVARKPAQEPCQLVLPIPVPVIYRVPDQGIDQNIEQGIDRIASACQMHWRLNCTLTVAGLGLIPL